MNTLFKEIKSKMDSCVKGTDRELGKVHAGRANPSMLDPVQVDAYGTMSKLNAIASVNVPDAKHIIIQPWDRSLLGAIERGIQKANLGFNPNNDGAVIRISIPALTGERRKELVKVAKKISEDGRIAIRNVRKHYKSEIENREKNHEISEDEKKKRLKELQDLTDSHVKQIDAVLKEKESELLSV